MRVGDVRQHDAAAVAAAVRRPGEVLLRPDQHVAALDAVGLHRAVRRAARVVHQHHGLRGAVVALDGRVVPRHAATGDEDRVERRRPADPVLVRVAVLAGGGVAAQAAAAGDPGDAPLVLIDVVRVVGVAVVAPQVDRLVGDDRLRRIAQVGDPDRPAVADQPVLHARKAGALRDDRTQVVLVVTARGAAGPDVLAVLDAARGVAGRQRHEVAHLRQVRRVRVGDDEEAAAAVGVAHCEPVVVGAARGDRVGLVVPRVERTDDQVALRVELHVLVLPVAVGRVDPGRHERVEELRVRCVGDVVRLEAEAAGDDEDVALADAVELAFGDAGGIGRAVHVLEVARHRRARRRIGCRRCGRCQSGETYGGCRCPSELHAALRW